MAATNNQVQAFVDQRVRPSCELIRDLYLRLKNDQAQIDDVYANLTNAPTWSDSRTDNPPRLMTANDVLAWNTFAAMFVKFIEGTLDNTNKNEAAAQYSVIVDACVRGVS